MDGETAAETAAGVGGHAFPAWQDVAPEAEVAEGETLSVSANGRTILLCRSGGKIFAVGSLCPHYDAPMAEGNLVGDRIMCPWHWWEFDLASGRCVYAPSETTEFFFSGEFAGHPTDVRLAVYPTRVQSGRVFARVPEEAG